MDKHEEWQNDGLYLYEEESKHSAWLSFSINYSEL